MISLEIIGIVVASNISKLIQCNLFKFDSFSSQSFAQSGDVNHHQWQHGLRTLAKMYALLAEHTHHYHRGALSGVGQLPWRIYIDKINNKLHGLSPPGCLVSPSGGFTSLAFDQAVPKNFQWHLGNRNTICIMHQSADITHFVPQLFKNIVKSRRWLGCCAENTF